MWHISKGDVLYHLCIVFESCKVVFIGIKKKLARLSNNKDCSIIGDWIKSITNHLYWCAASAPDDSNDIVKRWKSLMDHICDIHDECYHTDLSLEDRRKKWLIPGTESQIFNIHIVTYHLFIQGAKHVKRSVKLF